MGQWQCLWTRLALRREKQAGFNLVRRSAIPCMAELVPLFNWPSFYSFCESGSLPHCLLAPCTGSMYNRCLAGIYRIKKTSLMHSFHFKIQLLGGGAGHCT